MDMKMTDMQTDGSACASIGNITEFHIKWPHGNENELGSTHELAINDKFIFVSGQNMHHIAKYDYSGEHVVFYDMGKGSGPHGLLIDAKGQLWVSLEFSGEVVRLNEEGKIVQRIDVKMYPNADKSIAVNPAPHGIGLDADGATIWFTGKRTSTVGKISPEGIVSHFQLSILASMPIFLSAGKDSGMWGTELLGNCIYNVSPSGKVKEYIIPTSGSRPIAIIKDPIENCMWFTQEAGGKIGKIDARGKISEYPVPLVQKNDILASLCFDDENNLWVQVYVDIANHPEPTGNDYIVKFDKSIRQACGVAVTGVPFTTHIVPSRKVMMHRIKKDNKGNLWFTEMMVDTLGKITLNK